MPNNFSNGKQTTQKQLNALPWCSVTLDWPYEIAVAQVQITAKRQVNVLERVAVRILQDFADDPPTLAEAAEQLGIKDAVFLTETLQKLVESGIVELNKADSGYDFSNCRLSVSGKTISSSKQSISLPERHGLKLCFDALTGEHIPQQPGDTTEKPLNPIIPPQELPTQITDIGLDRARKYARAQDEQFMTGSSKLTDIKVQPDEGILIWGQLEASLSIDDSGIIRCSLPAATDKQRQWLQESDLKHELFDKLFSATITQADQNVPLTVKPYSQWVQSVDRLVAPLAVNEEVLNLLTKAQRQIILDAYWLGNPQVKNALMLAANRGVECTIFGRGLQLEHITNGLPDNVAFIEPDQPTDATDEIILAADGTNCLRIDKVQLLTSQKRQVEIIVASFLSRRHALHLQQDLRSRTAAV